MASCVTTNMDMESIGMIRSLIWGTGNYFNQYRDKILKLNVVAIVDSDVKKQGTIIDGIQVISPEMVPQVEFDKAYIMSTAIDSIKKQMLDLGVSESKICYCFDMEQNDTMSFPLPKDTGSSIKKAALISYDFTITGAPNCLYQMAKYLIKKGWAVRVASPFDGEMKKYFEEIGAESFVDERLRMGTLKNIEWVSECDVLVVNTVALYYLLRERDISIPVIWWLHEPPIYYRSVVPGIINSLPTENLRVYSVSKVADDAFHKVCKTMDTEQFLYGIEDCKKNVSMQPHDNIRFMIIGAISKLKGHDILLEALKLLDKTELDKCEFMLVGNNDSGFAKQIMQEMEALNVKFTSTGVISHEETLERLAESDVLICASRVESMSVAVTEAMMLEKPAIVSSAAGNVEYIEDGVNGYIFESVVPDALTEKIKIVLKDYARLRYIGAKGRKIFERVFVLDRFEVQVDEMLNG